MTIFNSREAVNSGASTADDLFKGFLYWEGENYFFQLSPMFSTLRVNHGASQHNTEGVLLPLKQVIWKLYSVFQWEGNAFNPKPWIIWVSEELWGNHQKANYINPTGISRVCDKVSYSSPSRRVPAAWPPRASPASVPLSASWVPPPAIWTSSSSWNELCHFTSPLHTLSAVLCLEGCSMQGPNEEQLCTHRGDESSRVHGQQQQAAAKLAPLGNCSLLSPELARALWSYFNLTFFF